MTRKRYHPVFAGKTSDDEPIVIYREDEVEDRYHIQLPNGELWALSPGSEWVTWEDLEESLIHLTMESPQWSGRAVGSKKDLVEAERR
jgi:hypothetical protein